MDELEEPDTKKLFLEQGSWETKQRKEMQEYLDAKNQEVTIPTPGLTHFFLSVFRKSEETVLNQVLEMTTEGDVIDEKTRETMAALNSQVRTV